MRVAMLTAGGIAPCLSSCVSDLISIYSAKAPNVELLGYRWGYTGLLKGDLVNFTPKAIKDSKVLTQFGGSPLGNSRVKLTNDKDLLKKGLIKEGQTGLQAAAHQLIKDKIDILHTIGGDDTNTTAADLAHFLQSEGYKLQVVGLPKTIDNDIVPIRQSFGADTASDVASSYARNFLAEHTATPKVLLIHEVMGRHSGWLTANSAFKYHEMVKRTQFFENGFDGKAQWDIHGIYIPEMPIDIEAEGKRLKEVIKRIGNANLFVAEGALPEDLFDDIDAPRDAFGHVQLADVNAGKWIGDQLQLRAKAEKVLVQKSGYFSRSAASNAFDLKLIRKACIKAVDAALKGKSGIIGQDDNSDHHFKNFKPSDSMQVIDFARVSGAKPFDVKTPWFQKMLKEIGQN